MFHKILVLTAIAAFGVAGTAGAAQAPTLGPVTVMKAGQKTPIDIAGSGLRQGATIRKGTEVRRWLVTMNGASNQRITLRCGPGARHVGLGQQENAKVAFRVANGSGYGRRTIQVQFRAAPKVDADGAKASVYALCKS